MENFIPCENIFGCILEETIKYFGIIIESKSTWASFFGAIGGAGLIYMTQVYRERKKENLRKLEIIHTVIGELISIINTLFGIKKDFVVPRKKEMQEVEDYISNQKVSGPPHLENSFLKMLQSEILLGSETRELSFTAEKDPSIIILISKLRNDLKTLDVIVKEINSFTLQVGLMPTVKLNKQQIDFLKSHINSLEQVVDRTISFSQKIFDLILEYGKKNIRFGYAKKLVIPEPISKEHQYLLPKKDYTSSHIAKKLKKNPWYKNIPLLNKLWSLK